MRAQFAEVVTRGAAGELEAWRESPPGALALVIVLDQFPRNLHRDSARAFAADAAARDVSLDALARAFDRALSPVERWFLYMPLMHAENRALQQRSVALYEGLAAGADPGWREPRRRRGLRAATPGRDRALRALPPPQRALGRASTREEIAFLEQPGSAF